VSLFSINLTTIIVRPLHNITTRVPSTQTMSFNFLGSSPPKQSQHPQTTLGSATSTLRGLASSLSNLLTSTDAKQHDDHHNHHHTYDVIKQQSPGQSPMTIPEGSMRSPLDGSQSRSMEHGRVSSSWDALHHVVDEIKLVGRKPDSEAVLTPDLALKVHERPNNGSYSL
jgi:hypothetical protein